MSGGDDGGNGKEPGEAAPLLLHAWSGASPGPSPGPSSTSRPDGKQAVVRALSQAQPCSSSISGVEPGTNAPDANSANSASSGRGGLHPAGTPWGMTAGLLLADMFGIGSLALPSVFARLGWLVSLALACCSCPHLTTPGLQCR